MKRDESKMITIPCKTCNKEFETYISKIAHGRRYCCKSCKAKDSGKSAALAGLMNDIFD